MEQSVNRTTTSSMPNSDAKGVVRPPEEPKVYVTLRDMRIIEEGIRTFKESSLNFRYLLGSDAGSWNSPSVEEEKAVKQTGKTSWRTTSDDDAVESYYYTVYCCGTPICSPNGLFVHLRNRHGVGRKSVEKKVCKTCHELISGDFIMLHKELVHYESPKGNYEIRFAKAKSDDKMNNYILLVPKKEV